MKYFSKVLMTISLSFFLMSVFGCSNNEENNNTNENQTTEETKKDEETTKSKYPFPNDTTAKGNGKIMLSTAAGTSENGNTPVLFVSEEDILIQIGMDAENFDGSKQSFVYVDKLFSNTEQFGELTQTSVNLQESMLKPGIHTVSVVQFNNDDPNNGSVTGYTEAKYEVKEKK
ncbi:hypothetical protein [Peribacillus asahii]|uniref:Uncharacterized protein n=1 Tax=Peribacillus asahii TaxID=228899 RepID=A0A3T0KQ25_9BACI|nr:hypothetical protein [Peribacillus asahii]AZV42552.1 hypothetical protein BAOM_1943 [Peribacillus asahii]USK86830.1 hypothetical protein LIT35_09425 [Peribacillus asahii]